MLDSIGLHRADRDGVEHGALGMTASAGKGMQAAESILRSLMENVPDRLMLLDLDLRIRYSNRGIFDVPRSAITSTGLPARRARSAWTTTSGTSSTT